jgi:voltage-gated potassium channel
MRPDAEKPCLKRTVYDIIFESDTPLGKAFDVVLLVLIFLSIVVLMLDSMETFTQKHGALLQGIEWAITAVFTVEYVLRLWCVKQHWKYVYSFFGIIDLLSILPAYLGLVFTGFQYAMVIRVLRLLRVFRVLKMVRYMGEATVLGAALKASWRKISIFIFVVINIVTIVGTLMYLIEGPEHGFVNIPVSVYWTIVTLTTVGYGDIAPGTPLGQTLASVLMILGYGIIAVPTGIVSVELAQANQQTHENEQNK